ncbi:MAG TPA: serine/threonine-protein kinase [Polyangiaceae bacterium]
MDRVADGTVLAGKYILVRKLGQGGMGAVWHAEHVTLRSPVAIKLIDQDIASNPEALARFMREAQSAAALRSPHVVQILDFGADNGVPYIAMELLEGESLASRIEHTRGLTPSETASVLTQVARAIAKAHEAGIVHRDLKPDNIFLVKNDEEEVAKVLDFGIAKATQGFGTTSGSNTRTGAILGTPYYMSPEQAEGNRHVDHRSDLWALGVIGFECLLGRRPFDSDALGSLLLAICTRPIPVPSSYGRVPPGFDGWFARACAREVGERFQSARELSAELRRVCGVGARESSNWGPSSGDVPATPVRAVTDGSAVPNVSRPLTANTYSASVGVEKSRGASVAWILGGVIAVVALAGGVALFMKQREGAAAETSTAAAQPTAAPPPVVAAPSPPATKVEVAPTVTVAPDPTPSASSTASAFTEPPVAPKVAVAHRGAPKPKPTPTTAKAASPPAPAATPTNPPSPPPAPKQKGINLGI